MSNTKSYKGIVFAPNYNRNFDEFKKEFGSTHVFKNIPEADRESELKKAYKIATDGNTTKPATESKEAKSK